MENDKKMDILVDEIKSSKEEIQNLKNESQELTKKLVDLNKTEMKKEKSYEIINKDFVEAMKNVKSIKDIAGKSFFINVKEAKLGDNQFYQNEQTIGQDRENVYDEVSSFFNVTSTDAETINHTYHQGRSILKLNNQPVPECSPAENCEYKYDQVKFAVEKYACCLPTSIEFTTFVNGGLDNAINSLIIDLENSFTRASFHLQSEVAGRYSLFNDIPGRSLPKVQTDITGQVTIDKLMDLRLTSNKSLLNTGAYFMPLSQYAILEKQKDNNGSYYFSCCASGQTISNFNVVATFANRPVVVVPDDVWFQFGEDSSTPGVELAGYYDPSAFEYFSATPSRYAQEIATATLNGDIVIEFMSSETNPGCINMCAYFLRGYGVTNPTGGVTLINSFSTATLSAGVIPNTSDTVWFGYLYNPNGEDVNLSRIEIAKADTPSVVINAITPATANINPPNVEDSFGSLQPETDYVVRLIQDTTILSSIHLSTTEVVTRKAKK